MRVMLKVSIPVESGNEGILSESLPKTMLEFVEARHPEAAYFVAQGGKRTALFVFDLPTTADIPSIVEPFFHNLDASIEVTPAMNVEDMRAGVGKALKKLGKK